MSSAPLVFRHFFSFYQKKGVQGTGSNWREEYSVVLFTRYQLFVSSLDKLEGRLRKEIPADFFRRGLRTYHGQDPNELVTEKEVSEPFNWAVFRHEIVRDDEVDKSERLAKVHVRLRYDQHFDRASIDEFLGEK